MKTLTIAIMTVLCLAACSSSKAENPPFPNFHGQGNAVTLIKQIPPYPCKNGYMVAPLVWAYKMGTDEERMFSSLFIKVPGAPGSSQEVLMEYTRESTEGNTATFIVAHAWIDRDGDYVAEEYFNSKEELLAKYKTACRVVGSENGAPPGKDSSTKEIPHYKRPEYTF